jgi:hypothetical protein
MIPSTTLFALKAVAKLYKGFVKSRMEKRQAETAALEANIKNNFVKSNLYSDATANMGNALLASHRAGGFAPSTLGGGLNDLAANLRTNRFNLQSDLASAAALKSKSRMSLIGGAIDAGLGYAQDQYDEGKWKKVRKSLLTQEAG